MNKINSLLFAIAASSLAGGCMVSGTMRTHAYVETPDMVALDSGVYVVQDADEPVFYSDNYYWRYDGGVWYRSGYYDRGWITVDTVPTRVRTIDHPYAYAHYHGDGRAVIRGHQDNGWHNGQGERPVVRDHRDNGWHNGGERREVRQENRQERREEARPVVREHRDAPATRSNVRPRTRDHR